MKDKECDDDNDVGADEHNTVIA